MRPTDGADRADLQLRSATVGDAVRLAAIQTQARRAAAMPDAIRDLADLTSWLRERIAEDETWVAIRKGVVVGYVRFTDTWLDDVFVEPSSSGMGIGSGLLDLVKSRLAAGFGLWVFEENAAARRFYARHGLLELETTDGSANEERRPDVRLVWPGQDRAGHLRVLLAEADGQLSELNARRAALLAALGEVSSQ